MRGDRLAAAAVVATLAFWLYTQTLLPGVDLGDTGGFQAAVSWPAVSARQSYPLYYGLARPFVQALSAANPARGLNLFSAVAGALATGTLTWIVAAIGGALLPGVAAGLLLAVSYTFWTQAIIAEVYTLHLFLVGLCLLALLAWSRVPSTGRLAIVFAIYALGFGNHLSMVLLLIPFAAFLLVASPKPRALFRPRIVTLAIAIAVLGALQYLPNVLAVVNDPEHITRWPDRLATFWFDATKADWRDTMVLGVDEAETTNRLAMWLWDSRQQFGIAGLLLVLAGAVRVWWISRPWAALLWSAWTIATLFAITYNVGDTHVFFLPAHYLAAMTAGLALAPRSSTTRVSRADRYGPPLLTVASLMVIAYAGWRAWDTWPAVDRHADRRGQELVAKTFAGIDDASSVLLSGMDWESENALLYTSRWERRSVAWLRSSDLLLHLPFFVDDNQAIDRDIVLTTRAAADVVRAYGDRFPLEPIDPVEPPLTTTAARIPRGAPYVVTILPPPDSQMLDADDLGGALGALTGNRTLPHAVPRTFQVIAGVAGGRPTYSRWSNRPFRDRISIAGERFDVRIESWLPFDTFRRAGFGHVVRGREHLLIVERGVSLLWFGPTGEPHTAYGAGLYAPGPRFRIPRATLRLASGGSDAVRPTRLPARLR